MRTWLRNIRERWVLNNQRARQCAAMFREGKVLVARPTQARYLVSHVGAGYALLENTTTHEVETIELVSDSLSLRLELAELYKEDALA